MKFIKKYNIHKLEQIFYAIIFGILVAYFLPCLVCDQVSGDRLVKDFELTSKLQLFKKVIKKTLFVSLK